MTRWLSFCPHLDTAKEILTLPGVLQPLAKPAKSGAPSSPQVQPRWARGTRLGSQTRYHPCSESPCCCGTDRPYVAANPNLIRIFCLSAGPQAPSGHSLGQPSLTVLCASKMAEKNTASKNLPINIAGEKNPKLTCKYAHD